MQSVEVSISTTHTHQPTNKSKQIHRENKTSHQVCFTLPIYHPKLYTHHAYHNITTTTNNTPPHTSPPLPNMPLITTLHILHAQHIHYSILHKARVDNPDTQCSAQALRLRRHPHPHEYIHRNRVIYIHREYRGWVGSIGRGGQ